MSAHARPIKVQCDTRGCVKHATWEVFNTYNAALGRYCTRHANEKVMELKRGERTAETERALQFRQLFEDHIAAAGENAPRTVADWLARLDLVVRARQQMFEEIRRLNQTAEDEAPR